MFTDKEQFKNAFIEKMRSINGKEVGEATNIDAYKTLSIMVKEYINNDWCETKKQSFDKGIKQAYYFSIEYLPGKMLHKNLLNLNEKTLDITRKGLEDLGFNFKELKKEEMEPGLGNGGLGRLASAFLDSLSSLKLPGHGYGLRYKYGLFEQKIENGDRKSVV